MQPDHTTQAKPIKPRRGFFAPNSKKLRLNQWRLDGRIKALGYLMHHGGILSGKQLAALLGMSPRGLRPLMSTDPVIKAVYHWDEQAKRGETCYKLDYQALPAPADAPPALIAGPGGTPPRAA